MGENLYHLPHSISAIVLASMGKYQLAYARPVCHMYAPSQQCLNEMHAQLSVLSHREGDY